MIHTRGITSGRVNGIVKLATRPEPPTCTVAPATSRIGYDTEKRPSGPFPHQDGSDR